MRITLLTHTNEAFKPISDLTIPIFQEYCARYGYGFIYKMEHAGGRHIVWEKIRLILDYFKGNRDSFDWLCYCDADVMIMNHTIPLETFIDDSVDFVGNNDCREYNAGVFFLKNSNWSLDFMQRVWATNPHNPTLRGRYNDTQGEQLSMLAAMQTSDDKDVHIKIVSQNLFNCYLYPHYGRMSEPVGDFKKGDFILHLAAMNTQERVDYINKYKELIIR